MIEHNTDRLFWTLAAIIVGSLLLTICLKTFPSLEHNAMSALTNITKTANTTNPSTEQKFIGGFNPSPNDAIGTKVNPDGNATKINVNTDNQDQINVPDASTLNISILRRNDGTAIIYGPADANASGSITIPKYVKVGGALAIVTEIGDYAYNDYALTSVTIPDSVTRIGEGAFGSNNLTSVNIPNAQGYQSAKSNNAFDSNVNLTNNPS